MAGNYITSLPTTRKETKEGQEDRDPSPGRRRGQERHRRRRAADR